MHIYSISKKTYFPEINKVTNRLTFTDFYISYNYMSTKEYLKKSFAFQSDAYCNAYKLLRIPRNGNYIDRSCLLLIGKKSQL